MKYKLSFCEIEQLSDNVFEIIANTGVMLDKYCADESYNFWNDLRDKAFGLLVNCKNQYSISFEGSQGIGRHYLQQKTAILCTDDRQAAEMKMVVEIKKMSGEYNYHQFFTDREEAIEWLSDVYLKVAYT